MLNRVTPKAFRPSRGWRRPRPSRPGGSPAARTGRSSTPRASSSCCAGSSTTRGRARLRARRGQPARGHVAHAVRQAAQGRPRLRARPPQPLPLPRGRRPQRAADQLRGRARVRHVDRQPPPAPVLAGALRGQPRPRAQRAERDRAALRLGGGDAGARAVGAVDATPRDAPPLALPLPAPAALHAQGDVAYSGGLHEPLSRSIELSNPAKKPIVYGVGGRRAPRGEGR